jgi:hypothetical protein
MERNVVIFRECSCLVWPTECEKAKVVAGNKRERRVNP